MTCLEKFRREYPTVPMERIFNVYCPHVSGEMYDMPEPDNCPHKNGRPECIECWKRELPDTESGTSSAVDHPAHYGREGAIECIDEMLLVFGVEATMNFCLLNAWKYRYRAAEKNGAEDIAKSDWYIAKYAELKGGD